MKADTDTMNDDPVKAKTCCCVPGATGAALLVALPAKELSDVLPISMAEALGAF